MTNSDFSKAEQAAISAAQEFASGYLQPNSQRWEHERQMPREMFQEAANAGLCGLLVRPENGGMGIGTSALMRVMEELSYVDMAAAFALVVHNNHVRLIDKAGTPEQITGYLPKMLAGEIVGAFLLTEPGGGSDAAAITTSALPEGRGYVLNGEKAWITNTPHADLLNVFAQTEPGAGPAGIVSLQIPANSPGVERVAPYQMLGGYAMNAGGYRFHEVQVAADQVLLPPGQGFRAAMAGIDIARTVVAAMCCGMLQSCLDTVTPQLLQRQAFGQPLFEQQGLAWKIADVATNLTASRLLAEQAATLVDAGEPAAVAAAHAKKFATEAALPGIATCMQAMGADGLLHGYPFARHLAAAKIAQYIDGTTEIQNVVISRALRRQYATTNN